MRDLPECFGRRSAHALRGRRFVAQLGVLDLELFELTQEVVVLGVADRRRIEQIVAAIVLIDRAPQLANALRGTLLLHGARDTTEPGLLKRRVLFMTSMALRTHVV